MKDTIQPQEEARPDVRKPANVAEGDSCSTCICALRTSPPQPPVPLPSASAYRRPRQTGNDPDYIDVYRKRHSKRILPVLQDFQNVLHVYLTVDRDIEPDPAKALFRLPKELTALVKKLRRKQILGNCRYIWFAEFHKDGFPHLHVLLEAKQSVFSEIQEHYDFGKVGFRRFECPYDHLGYVTKQWNPEFVSNRLPEWLVNLDKEFKRFRGSRGFFGLPPRTVKTESPTSSYSQKRNSRTIAELRKEIDSDLAGDIWLKVPRSDGKNINLACSRITDRDEVERIFGTNRITIDMLAGVQSNSPVINALFRSFGEVYKKTPTRKNLQVIARATAELIRISEELADPND